MPTPQNSTVKKQAQNIDLIEERRRVAAVSTWVSVLVNIFLSIAQIVIGILAHSSALVADAIHTFTDLVSDGAVLVANKFSSQAADEQHPYGHFRFENLTTLFIGVLLAIVGLGMIWQAGDRLLGGAQLVQVHYAALIVATIVLIGKELLFRYLLREGKRVDSSMLIVNAWHARSDALSSLIVLVAIAANLMGLVWADIVASLIVGAMIAHMGIKYTWQSMHDLSDQAADEEQLKRIEGILKEVPSLHGYHDLRTRKTGDYILVDVHLEFPANMTVGEAHDISDEVDRRVHELGNILEVTTHFDPV